MIKMMNKKRAFLASGAALVLLLQTAGPVFGDSMETIDHTAATPTIQLPQPLPSDAPIRVMEGFEGEIPFTQAPFLEQSTLLVPARALLERLGFRVDWDAQEQTVIAEKQNTTWRFPINQAQATFNTIAHRMPTSTKLIGDMAYIPLRFAVEADHREVKWNPNSKMAIIQKVDSLKDIRVIAQVDSPLSKDEYQKLGLLAANDLNINLNMMTYPSQNYQERVNVIVAAGDTPDLLLVPDPFGWNNDIFDGMFWDLNPYIHDYPHLQAVINSFEGRLTRDNGGLYGIPRLSNPDIGVFPALRKDWLEKVGLTIPHTMEQLYEVLQAFEARDPDGNGKKDTVALAGSVNALSLGDLSWVENVFNESGGRFKLQDGVIIDTTVEPGTKEALKWLRDAFAAGILAKDFAVASSDQAMNLVTSNHGGTMALSQQLVWKANQELRDSISNPAVDFSQLAYLQAREGGAKVVPSSIGHTGIFTIPKNVTEAKLKRILAFLENWLSGDIPEDEYNSLLPLEPFFGQRSASTVTNVELSASEQESVLQILEERAAIQFTHGNDPTLGLFSNEMRSAMHTIDQMLTQTKIKIIVGQLPLNEWDRILAQLKSDSQYLSVMKELNEKSNKKMASIAN